MLRQEGKMADKIVLTLVWNTILKRNQMLGGKY
jgi:hypothetical protein